MADTSAVTMIQDHISITRLLNLIAYAEDTLDWALFESCWTAEHLLHIDLSSHLSQYSSNLQISASDLARTSHLQLSGFDGTQHVLSNFVIDIDDNGRKASARAYCTSFHAFKQSIEEGPSSVLVRGVWTVSCIKEIDGQWRAIGIKVDRMVGSEGDERLYVLAKEKAEAGNGRDALTLWRE